MTAKQKVIALCKINPTSKGSLVGQECSDIVRKLFPFVSKTTESRNNDFQVLYLVKMSFRKFSL